MRALLASLASLLLCLALPGQVTPLTRSLPRAFAGWDAPEGNWLPLGRSRTFLQTWYHGADLRPGSISEIGWRIDRDATAPAAPVVMEITLASTPATFATLSPTFAKNLGSTPVVFKKLTSISYPAVSRPQDPDQPAVWIKGDRPFVFTGPHLVVQVDVQTSTTYNYIRTYHVDSYVSEGPIHGTSGKSCGAGVLAADSEPGWWLLALSGLKAQDPGIFMLGIEHVQAGPAPLPIDLTPVGMEGCTLDLVAIMFRASVADSTGTARFRLPVPTLVSDPLVIRAQTIELDFSKTARLATSNAVHSILNEHHLSNYLFNWGRDGPVAEYGPFATNRAAVLLWKP